MFDFHRMYRSILVLRLTNFALSIIHKRNLFLEMYVEMNTFLYDSNTVRQTQIVELIRHPSVEMNSFFLSSTRETFYLEKLRFEPEAEMTRRSRR